MFFCKNLGTPRMCNAAFGSVAIFEGTCAQNGRPFVGLLNWLAPGRAGLLRQAGLNRGRCADAICDGRRNRCDRAEQGLPVGNGAGETDW